MNPLTLAEICKETGLSIGVFILCAWITVFIVKRLSASIDKLVDKIEKHDGMSTKLAEKIINGVDKHDEKATERGKYIREEHQSLLNGLKEVEKSLAGLNGKKS